MGKKRQSPKTGEVVPWMYQVVGVGCGGMGKKSSGGCLMDNLKIETLHIQHFKGMTDFGLDAGGQDIAIRGANATGKTSVADSYCWGLFGKDSQGRADFALRPLDEDNDLIPGLDTVVEIDLIHNDKAITLKKLCKAKKTGGLVTEHWVDGVPKKATEFKAFVDSITGGEEAYRLMSDPTYFATIPWQRRREILIDLVGDISAQEVIESDPELSGIADILEGGVK